MTKASFGMLQEVFLLIENRFFIGILVLVLTLGPTQADFTELLFIEQAVFLGGSTYCRAVNINKDWTIDDDDTIVTGHTIIIGQIRRCCGEFKRNF